MSDTVPSALADQPSAEQQGTPPEPDFVCTRVFSAPRSIVFRAFTDGEILARWWGPEGFTNSFREFNPAPGAVWRFVMHGPDGRDYPMVNEFVDVVPDEKIVLQHHQPGHDFRLEMVYADDANGTRLTWRIWFASVEEAERVRPFLNQANEQNFDRLEARLAAPGSPGVAERPLGDTTVAERESRTVVLRAE